MRGPIQSALPLVLAAALAAGCTPATDKAPLLTSLGAITVSMTEIAEQLEAGDLQAVDDVMHRGDFGSPFQLIKMQAAKSGLGQAAQDALLEARGKLQAELQTIHSQAHGGSIDELDVPAIVESIRATLGDIESALPADWAIPGPVAAATETAAEHDQDGDHNHDEHEGQGHDHDAHEEATEDQGADADE